MVGGGHGGGGGGGGVHGRGGGAAHQLIDDVEDQQVCVWGGVLWVAVREGCMRSGRVGGKGRSWWKGAFEREWGVRGLLTMGSVPVLGEVYRSA
jgi:hypothetical protein